MKRLRPQLARFATSLLVALTSLLTGCSSAPVQPFVAEGIGPTPRGFFDVPSIERLDILPEMIEQKLDYPPRALHQPGLVSIESELNEVKQIIDANFIHVSDKRLYQKREEWRAPIDLFYNGGTLFGDCEDYALLARAMLLKRGIPSRLIYTITGNGVGHVITEVNGWIIDNRMRRVVTRDSLMGYRFISISPEVLQAYALWADASANNGVNQLRGRNTLLAQR